MTAENTDLIHEMIERRRQFAAGELPAPEQPKLVKDSHVVTPAEAETIETPVGDDARGAAGTLAALVSTTGEI